MAEMELPGDEYKKEPGLLHFARRYRRPLFLLGLLWFGLVLGAGIFLSTLDARSGLHVFGSQIWRANTPSVLRVSLRELRLNRSKPLGAVAGYFLDASGQKTGEFELTQTAGHYIQGNVIAPNRPGRYSVHLTAIDDDVPLTAQFAINVTSPAMDVVAHTLIEPPKDHKQDIGPTRFFLEPLDGVLANGLPDTLVLASSSTRENHGAIHLNMSVGSSSVKIPSSFSDGTNSIRLIRIHPSHPFFRFTIKNSSSESTRQLKPIATQFTTQLESPVVSTGRSWVDVRSLYRDGIVFLDFWVGEHWMYTTSGQLSNYTARIVLDVPQQCPKHTIGWIRAYRNAYLPGTARGGRHILIRGGSDTSALSWLLEYLTGLGDKNSFIFSLIQQSQLRLSDKAKIALGRLTWPEHAPPLLADSGETNRQTIRAMKDTWQTRFVVALGGTGAIILLILGVMVGLHHRDLERRWSEAGGDEDGARGTRDRIALDVGYIFLIVALFIIGMIQLLLWIRW